MDMSGKRKEIEMNKKKEILDGYSGSTQISLYLEYMREKIAGAEHLSPISTGFGDLNYFLNGGLYPEQLVAVGAMPSVGKTSFVVSLIRNMLERNKNILFFSLDMFSRDIIRRLLAGASGISLREIIECDLSTDAFKYVISAAQQLWDRTFFIVDTPGLSIEKLEKIVWAAVSTEPIDCILIDSFNLIECCANSETDRYKRIANVLRRLECCNAPIVTTFQCPYDKSQREPSLADVPHDIYPLVNESDVVFFLHRTRFVTDLDQYYNDDAIVKAAQPVKIIVEKNRNGDTGVINIRFNGFTTSFERLP